jgi:glucoamylase
LGYPVDRPVATWRRYGGTRPKLDYEIWGPGYCPQRVRAGHALSVATRAPALVHWGVNGWTNVGDVATRDTGLGVHVADLPITGLQAGETVQFTFRWRETGAWEGRDHEVVIGT